MTQPCDLTGTEALSRIASGKLTAKALVQSCSERIHSCERDVGAWQHLDIVAALEKAAALDQSTIRGPLHGIPFGVKDIIDTADMPTEYGSPIYKGNRTAWDAACVAMTRAAGGILLGKTVTTEFAHRFPGRTRNPHNLAHTPGGSSSGSAAAVAARMVPLAIGTQTGGSTIRPAAYCGIVGYKASFGDFSLFGVREQTRSFDSLGLFARSIDDIGLLRAVLLRDEWTALPTVDGRELRIGFCRTPYWSEAEDSTRTLLEESAKRLARAGAKISDVELPRVFSRLREAARSVSGFEFARGLTYELTHHADKLSKVLREGRAADGLNCTYERYAEGRKTVAECRRQLGETLDDYDVLIAPAAPGEAPEGISSTGNPIFNAVWNYMDVPALTLPAFTGPKGLPVGVQLVGKWFLDRELLSAAGWIGAHVA